MTIIIIIINFERRIPIPSFGMNLSFCSLLPYSLIGCITNEDWTLIADRYPLSTLSISRAINPYATDVAPAHPYSNKKIGGLNYNKQCVNYNLL